MMKGTGSVCVRLRAPGVETLRREVFGILSRIETHRLQEILARVGIFPDASDALLCIAVGDVPRRLARFRPRTSSYRT